MNYTLHLFNIEGIDMRSNKDILEFMVRTSKTPKAYLEQLLSVGDNEEIYYYKYTLLTSQQQISVRDVSEIVIIPDDRDVIIGDFNSTDKKAGVMNVVTSIMGDLGVACDAFPTIKTPIWDYAETIDKLHPKYEQPTEVLIPDETETLAPCTIPVIPVSLWERIVRAIRNFFN
jgi:hypothetical protein